MGKRIIIAGAGHGGLVAGALLARKGYDVNVYEQQKRKDMGYDWTDVFDITCLEEAGVPALQQSKLKPSHGITYTNPNANSFIRTTQAPPECKAIVDRKYLIKHLIAFAKASGVKMHYETKITAPICTEDRVIGFVTEKNGKQDAVFGDLIIDCAGMNSAVRTLIPERFNIHGKIEDTQMFTVYRAFFKKEKDQPEPDDVYTVHFYHMREPGISWVINEDKYMDVLVGRFGDNLTYEQAEEAVEDLRERYPAIGHELARGGTISTIPIRRTLPLIIANGYTLIGDSAAMTIPMIGSGITNSIRAAKILADTISEDKDEEYTAETLWNYQYKYFTEIGNKLVLIDKLRELATSLHADDVDYLLEKEILSEKLIAIGTGRSTEFSITQAVKKIFMAMRKAPMMTSAAMTAAKIAVMKRTLNAMPPVYDKTAVTQWTEKYNKI